MLRSSTAVLMLCDSCMHGKGCRPHTHTHDLTHTGPTPVNSRILSVAISFGKAKLSHVKRVPAHPALPGLEMSDSLTIPEVIGEELAGILRRVQNTPQSLVDWLEAEELTQPADVGAVTNDESKVPAAITALLTGQDVLRVRHRSAVVRVWWLCRTAMSREEGIATGKVRRDDDAPLDSAVSDPCHAAWTQRCGYRILSCKLLIETTLRSILNELSAKPRRLTVRLAENLRTQTCIDRGEASALVFRAGQAPTKTIDINDEITDKYCLWMRIRAWLFSISWLTVTEKTFLSPAKAEAYSETLLELLHQRFDGTPAPLSHYITAYLQSARIWVEAVRDGKSLENALSEEATWRHLWSTYARPMASTPEKTPRASAGNSGADIPDSVTKEMSILRQQNKQFQSERDLANNRLRQKSGSPAPPAKKKEETDPRAKRRRVIDLRPNRNSKE